MILLMSTLILSDKYTLSQVYLLRDKLINKDRHSNIKRRHISIIKRKENSSIYMGDKEKIKYK